MDELIAFLPMIVILVILYVFYIYIPATMAEARGRSQVGWVILGIITNPLVSMVLLAVIGDSPHKETEEI